MKMALMKSCCLKHRNYKNKISIFPKLSSLLQNIRTEVVIDENKLVRLFWADNRESINVLLERNSFAVSGDPMVKIDLYITEDPNILYAEFLISYNCEDLSSEGRSDAILIINGDCRYLEKEHDFLDFRRKGEELSYKTEDGEIETKRSYILFADGIVLGHRTIEHSVRYKL